MLNNDHPFQVFGLMYALAAVWAAATAIDHPSGRLRRPVFVDNPFLALSLIHA